MRLSDTIATFGCDLNSLFLSAHGFIVKFAGPFAC